MGLGHWELLLVIFVVLLLFGGKKFPELAKGLGKGLREFKKSVKEPDNSDRAQVESAAKKDESVND
ncbi:MAG: twin-arginine translocase TatA/TatE family subunit [bacterium]